MKYFEESVKDEENQNFDWHNYIGNLYLQGKDFENVFLKIFYFN